MDYSVIFVFGVVVFLFILQFYITYFRTNDVMEIDVASLYCRQQLIAKYGPTKGYVQRIEYEGF